MVHQLNLDFNEALKMRAFCPSLPVARNGTRVSSDARNAPHEQIAHSSGCR
jgi:hypothetical protein